MFYNVMIYLSLELHYLKKGIIRHSRSVFSVFYSGRIYTAIELKNITNILP